MVIAVAIVRMVKMSVDEVVNVITMRYRFMAAVGAMDVGVFMGIALVARSADGRICWREGNHVLVDVAVVEMMQVAIVQIVNVILVLDGSMTATGLMLMVVTGMGVTGRHSELLLECS